MKKKTALLTLLLFGIIFLHSCSDEKKNKTISKENIIERVSKNFKYGFPLDDYRLVVDTVRQNETLSDILSKYNVSGKQIYDLAKKTKKVFPVRNFRAEHQYTLLFSSSDSIAKPFYFIYEKDPLSYVVYELKDSINIRVEEYPREGRYELYGNIINKSLWYSLTENGKSPALAMSLADVYRWNIDFYGIQRGDSYKVFYSEDYVSGSPVGNIYPIASVFRHKGSPYYAFWFERGNVTGYFDENGISLHKSFLKNPLKFSRISSRFSGNRFHPVTGRYRPHLGVDYAAPTGTPIRCVGDGVIVKKAYQRRGAGKYLKIKHNKTYTTVYMHMSSFAKGIKVGDHVKQGQLIGRVGMTGLATGPHLHYSVLKNGKYIDPLRVKSSPQKPLTGAVLKDFIQVKDSLMQKLNGV